MTQADYLKKVPPKIRANIERNQVTPQKTAFCHNRAEEHLKQTAVREEQRSPSLIKKVQNLFGSYRYDDDRGEARRQLYANSPFSVRAPIQTPESIYKSGDHSVIAEGMIPHPTDPGQDQVVLQDFDHTHHPETQRIVNDAAAKHGVRAHELTPEQINAMPGGGPHLFTRVVPADAVLGQPAPPPLEFDDSADPMSALYGQPRSLRAS